MTEIIKNILLKSADQIAKRNQSINFVADFEGKGLLNKEISILYDKTTVLSEKEFTDVVINSIVIIEKMAKLKKCDWDISELKSKLDSGIVNYQKRNGSNFSNNHSDKSKLLTATSIGEHFKISSKRLNLLLNELGWIEKTVQGWGITQLGKSLGGKQIEHETSGGTYVLWPDTIFKNNDLLEMFQETPKEKPTAKTPTQIIEKSDTETVDDFRKKYPTEYRTKDGHYVRSKAELTIDDSLYLWGIAHAYEKKLPNTEKVVYSDFHIPSGNERPKAVYIEYWGLENDEKYNKRKAEKIEIYNQLGLNLIQLNDADIKNIEDSLQKYLLKYGIKVN
jgi:hypothetical protein